MMNTARLRGSNTAIRILLSVAVTAVLTCGSSLGAQDQRTGSLVPGGGGSSMVQEAGRPRLSDRLRTSNPAAIRRAANEAHVTLRQFASCIVSGAGTSRERRELATFLRTSPDDAAVVKQTNKIVREYCLNGTGADYALLRFDSSILRGAIFRQLYLDVGTKSSAPVTRDEISSVWSPSVGGNFGANQRFGDCIVAADQNAADAFVRAKVGSAQQDASLQAVMSRMSGCLTQGLTLKMSRVVLDGVLAEALYRNVTAPGVVNSAGRSLVAHER
jgi:hypothetical protein